MPQVKFIGTQGVPLAGTFIYPGETREVSALKLAEAEAAHPGWFEVMRQDAAETRETSEEVTDANAIEHTEQPLAGRRAGAKRRTQ